MGTRRASFIGLATLVVALAGLAHLAAASTGAPTAPWSLSAAAPSAEPAPGADTAGLFPTQASPGRSLRAELMCATAMCGAKRPLLSVTNALTLLCLRREFALRAVLAWRRLRRIRREGLLSLWRAADRADLAVAA